MESLHQFTDLSRLDQVAAHIRRIKRDLQECDEEARRFNSREALFGKDLTEYSSLTDVQKAFEPYCDLWEVRGHRISKEGTGKTNASGPDSGEMLVTGPFYTPAKPALTNLPVPLSWASVLSSL